MIEWYNWNLFYVTRIEIDFWISCRKKRVTSFCSIWKLIDKLYFYLSSTFCCCCCWRYYCYPFKAKLDGVKTYMRMRRVPNHLQVKVIKWFDYLWLSQKCSDEERAVSCLPTKLKVWDYVCNIGTYLTVGRLVGRSVCLSIYIYVCVCMCTNKYWFICQTILLEFRKATWYLFIIHMYIV